ncbi:Hypothetical protein NTJ_10606 [Nesidiocoris tenuis]|uniref:Uncharacterized protein n=1 Tax=Nesidiocoris tenuis TaxID=355587 RepID=A0ABN7B049_9HEMI|nr:Hypothetical protein NTJ_10606 [Nesidiocoris tenuis]
MAEMFVYTAYFTPEENLRQTHRGEKKRKDLGRKETSLKLQAIHYFGPQRSERGGGRERKKNSRIRMKESDLLVLLMGFTFLPRENPKTPSHLFNSNLSQ